jgi:hypothetical protein
LRRPSPITKVRSYFELSISVPIRRSVKPGEAHRLRRRVVHGEDHLKDRRSAGIGLRGELLHQALEGHVLMGIGAQAGLANAREQLDEAVFGTRARARSTSALMKKPMSFSVSGCVRLVIEVPTRKSLCPVER